MGIKVGSAPKGGNRPPAPKGNHVGICVRVFDLGTQKGEWEGKVTMKRKIRFGFELPDERYEFDPEKGEQPFIVDTTFNFSSHKDSNFIKAMSSWTGEEIGNDFDIEDMLGKPAMVNVTHTAKNGKVYGNIEGITPVPKALLKTIQKPDNKPVYWSVENGRDSIFEKFPDFLKEMAEASAEWQTEGPDGFGDGAKPQPSDNDGLDGNEEETGF